MYKMVGWLLFGAFFVLLICFGSHRSKLTAIRVLDSAFTLMSDDESTTRHPTLEGRDAPPITTNRATTTKRSTTQRVKRYVSPYTKKLVAASQHWKCRICGRELDASYEIDHIVPLHKNGGNEISNLEAICRSPCHISKSAREAHRG